MTLRIEADGEECLLTLRLNGTLGEYELDGARRARGVASIEQVMPGVYSVLQGRRSFTVRLFQANGSIAAYVNGRRFALTVSDLRDRAGASKGRITSGPQEVRASMPGKVVKVLVGVGDEIKAGGGLIIVEAMKMQNEMKALEGGRVTQIKVSEGATVAAGEVLLVLE